MVKQDLYERVDQAVERGEMWRAKEMLRGNIGSASYDSKLYERYGKLLMDLGELVEAGKFFFLSGRRDPEYEKAIMVYLSRYPRGRPELLFRSFPSGARFRELHRYPLDVRRTLEERGLPQHFADVQRQRTERWRSRAAASDGKHTGLITHVPGTGGWFGYAPFEHQPYFTPARFAGRLLLQGLFGALGLLMAASTLVGLVVIVRWVVSLA